MRVLNVKKWTPYFFSKRIVVGLASASMGIWVGLCLGACAQEAPVKWREKEIQPAPMLIARILFNSKPAAGFAELPKRLDSIEIFFSEAINRRTLSSNTVSFIPVGNAQRLQYTLRSKAGDSVVVLRMNHPAPILAFGAKYTLAVTPELLPLNVNSDGMRFQGYSFVFSEPPTLDNSVVVLFRTVDDTLSQRTLGDFYRLFEHRVMLNDVRLIFKPGMDATLKVEGKEVTLDQDGFYTQVFNFEKKSTISVEVISQSGSTHKYTVTLVKRPSMRLFSSAFKDGDTLNVKYLARLDPSLPPSVSPPLEWDELPDGTDGLILLAWNESFSAGAFEWFIFNIPATLPRIEEGEILQNATILIPYEGVNIPPRGSAYTIHYILFAIQRKDPLNQLAPPSNVNELFNKLIEYKTAAESQHTNQINRVVRDDFHILATATIQVKSFLPN